MAKKKYKNLKISHTDPSRIIGRAGSGVLDGNNLFAKVSWSNNPKTYDKKTVSLLIRAEKDGRGTDLNSQFKLLAYEDENWSSRAVQCNFLLK